LLLSKVVTHWQISRDRILTLDRPRVMAILNLTPDSFSDGGSLDSVEAVISAAGRAVAEGADLLDLGGESTRPGAARVCAEEQLRRVLPALLAIRRSAGPLGGIPISIDTTLSSVAAPALDAGADIVNDVSAGTEDPGLLDLAARTGAGLILMHRLAPPERDSYSDRYAEPPRYDDVVATVRAFLADRAAAAAARGVRCESIVVDPGLGFGKTVAQNLELVRRTGEIAALGFPVLSGISRKSFTAAAAGLEGTAPRDRLAPSLALSTAHLRAGASIFRVHDVAPHVQALRAAAAVGA
jgi:dihydropteroate synthase